jgi:hypothetical protein
VICLDASRPPEKLAAEIAGLWEGANLAQ